MKLQEFLSKPYCQVIVKDEKEFNFVNYWAKEQGKQELLTPFLNTAFPISIFLYNDIVGWNNNIDRVGEKVNFVEFVNMINE